jgi:hypothetical protein
VQVGIDASSSTARRKASVSGRKSASMGLLFSSGVLVVADGDVRVGWSVSG